MIEAYSFGTMVVDGETHTADLIVLPGRVLARWWRRKGHELGPGDLEAVLEAKPEVLVVGTGAYGAMQVPPEVRERLEKEGITLIVLKTGKAWTRFNELSGERKVAGAFHLTC